MKIPFGVPMPGAECQNCERADRLSLHAQRDEIWIECDCGAYGPMLKTLMLALARFAEGPLMMRGRTGIMIFEGEVIPFGKKSV